MGGEVKTGASDEFQNLEMEMKLRHEGRTLFFPRPPPH